MTDEYGSHLLLSILVNFFLKTTPILWVYPILAFTFVLRYKTGMGRILYDMFNEPLRVSSIVNNYPIYKGIFLNTGYALLILIAFVSLALMHGLGIAILGIILVEIKIIDDISGVPKVAVVTALLVFIGHVRKQSSHLEKSDF